MRIDPRHFNKFMVVVAVVAAILIAIATMNYIAGRKSAFQQQMMEADSLGYTAFPRFEAGDSLQLNQFTGQYLLLDFWADWSEPSLTSHRALQNMPESVLNRLSVVAASVRTGSADVAAYRQQNKYAFEYVDGTDFFQKMNLPGVPSQVLFNPKGEVIATFVGYTDSTRYDSLQTLIRHE